MKERRRYTRIHTAKPLKLKFRVVSGKGHKTVFKRGRTHTRDISGSGMFIEMPSLKDEVAEGLLAGKNKIILDLKIPGLRSPIRLQGKAAWMDRKGTSRRKTFGVGVHFEDMSEADRERLLQYMLDLVLK